jgi:hypothetical protein
LPQLEESALHEQINFAASYDSPTNAPAAAKVLPIYLCPSTVRLANGREGSVVTGTTTAGKTYLGGAIDYGGIYGAAQLSPAANGVFLYERPVKFTEITDGTSRTLALAEDTGRGWGQDGEWINGENIYDVSNQVNTQQHNEIWSDHVQGAMVLWCDSGVTLLDSRIDFSVLRAACTRAGNDFANDAR